MHFTWLLCRPTTTSENNPCQQTWRVSWQMNVLFIIWQTLHSCFSSSDKHHTRVLHHLTNTTLVLFIICLDTELSYLMSSFSRNLIVGLHWVQSVIKKWWPDLSANGNTLKDTFSEDKYALAMHCWYPCLLLCLCALPSLHIHQVKRICMIIYCYCHCAHIIAGTFKPWGSSWKNVGRMEPSYVQFQELQER